MRLFEMALFTPINLKRRVALCSVFSCEDGGVYSVPQQLVDMWMENYESYHNPMLPTCYFFDDESYNSCKGDMPDEYVEIPCDGLTSVLPIFDMTQDEFNAQMPSAKVLPVLMGRDPPEALFATPRDEPDRGLGLIDNTVKILNTQSYRGVGQNIVRSYTAEQEPALVAAVRAVYDATFLGVRGAPDVDVVARPWDAFRAYCFPHVEGYREADARACIYQALGDVDEGSSKRSRR